MRTRMRWSVGLAVGLSLLLVKPVQAQVFSGQFTVAPKGSYVLFDESSALDDAAMLGIDAAYYFGETGFGLGFLLDVGRPETDGRFFTPIRLDFGPESELRFVGIRTTLLQFAGQALYRFALTPDLSPLVAVGVGGYAFYPDNQQLEGIGTVTGFAVNFGGGLDIRVAETSGFRLEVRDFVFFDYDREELNVVDPAARDDRFPEKHGTPPEAKDTTHNIRLSLSFNFVPGIR